MRSFPLFLINSVTHVLNLRHFLYQLTELVKYSYGPTMSLCILFVYTIFAVIVYITIVYGITQQ